MKCPHCGHDEQKVLDSRPARDNEAIRRRRECVACARRFTTFEQVERLPLVVIKRDGGREEFDREKILASMVTACRKRPVPVSRLQQAVEQIERDLQDAPEDELTTVRIGQHVMRALLEIDEIGYVRFASVYEAFDSPEEFARIVESVRPKTKGL
ncbi:MAG: transcriptional regulator NrdR [Fimbriimonadaceae bacterium]